MPPKVQSFKRGFGKGFMAPSEEMLKKMAKIKGKMGTRQALKSLMMAGGRKVRGGSDE
jgi:hypothetical protein